MNNLVEPFDASEPVKLSGVKQARATEHAARRAGRDTLPSRDITLRDAHWNEKFLVSQSYMWGRKDAGEQTDPNFDMAFCEAYADAYWEFNRHKRVYMPCLSTALERFREMGAV